MIGRSGRREGKTRDGRVRVANPPERAQRQLQPTRGFKAVVPALIARVGIRRFLIGWWKRRVSYPWRCRNRTVDPWHIRHPYEWASYKQALVEALNHLQLQTVVDVGCGLGEIVARVNARERYGIDLDGEVLAVARGLHKDVQFLQGSFSRILDLGLPSIDCLMMVNWPHEIGPDALRAELTRVTGRVAVRYLAVDEAPFQYRHDYGALLGQDYQHSLTIGDFQGRTLHLFAKQVTQLLAPHPASPAPSGG